MAVTIIDSASFEETINSGKTVLVDFAASWCGPCKALAPILEEISETLPETQMIAKLDIDENVDIARSFGVMSVPTMITFRNGQALTKMIGLHNKDEVVDFINDAVNR